MIKPNRLAKTILFLFFVATIIIGQKPLDINCFSILAGKEATVDGSVLLAHNEDDWGDLLVDWYKVPRVKHNKGEKLVLQNGAEVEQVEETYSYLWVQMPTMRFSDSYMNEWGVTIASDQCLSREDKGDLENGGIGYFLRRIMVERAKTAREAIEIAGGLIEEFGYNYSGRTYCVADKNEVWMMAVVKGKHWVAQRVPAENIAIIPNYYTIKEIDLGDKDNFLGSEDIINYAIDRGWYNEDLGKVFNFREAYSDRRALKGIWNIPRHIAAINLLSEKQYEYYDELPFSFIPKNKVSIADIMTVLANHFEGTEFEVSSDYNKGNPHFNTINRVCSEGNQYGMVAQLRDGLPKEIGSVMWVAQKRPCIQPFIPWYFGIESIPESYTRGDYKKALKNHFEDEALVETTIDKGYWSFKRLADICDDDFAIKAKPLRENKKVVEQKLLNGQKAFEKEFLELNSIDEKKAVKFLTDFVYKAANENVDFARKMMMSY